MKFATKSTATASVLLNLFLFGALLFVKMDLQSQVDSMKDGGATLQAQAVRGRKLSTDDRLDQLEAKVACLDDSSNVHQCVVTGNMVIDGNGPGDALRVNGGFYVYGNSVFDGNGEDDALHVKGGSVTFDDNVVIGGHGEGDALHVYGGPGFFDSAVTINGNIYD